MAELGNLIAGIFLRPRGMSTVKIRARSLFRTPGVPNWGFGGGFSTSGCRFSSFLHRPRYSYTGCTQAVSLCRLRGAGFPVHSQNKIVSR